MSTVKREFLVERQGKTFALYAGLLDSAHGEGLKAIRTKLLQAPSEENGQTAICSAEVETERGLFSGIGDASPANVSRQMLTCTIRMAETRAKARALRDAINVGVAAFEELGDDHEELGDGRVVDRKDGVIQQAPKPATPRAPENAPRPPPAPNGNLATLPQVRAIYAIGQQQHGLSEEEIKERSESLFGVVPNELTRKQASDLITSLKGNR